MSQYQFKVEIQDVLNEVASRMVNSPFGFLVLSDNFELRHAMNMLEDSDDVSIIVFPFGGGDG